MHFEFSKAVPISCITGTQCLGILPLSDRSVVRTAIFPSRRLFNGKSHSICITILAICDLNLKLYVFNCQNTKHIFNLFNFIASTSRRPANLIFERFTLIIPLSKVSVIVLEQNSAYNIRDTSPLIESLISLFKRDQNIL